MKSRSGTPEIVGILPDGTIGPTRKALLMALIDHARHDQRFRIELRHAPVATAARIGITIARIGITIADCEGAGSQDLPTD